MRRVLQFARANMEKLGIREVCSMKKLFREEIEKIGIAEMFLTSGDTGLDPVLSWDGVRIGGGHYPACSASNVYDDATPAPRESAASTTASEAEKNSASEKECSKTCGDCGPVTRKLWRLLVDEVVGCDSEWHEAC